MKRKPQIPSEPVSVPEIVVPPVVATEIREGVLRSIDSDRIKSPAKCSVCGAEATPGASEQLCWVCRRLKISAWRDVEQQMPAQE